MKVTFQNPLQGKPFHLVNNNPFLANQPKTGVYIYGLLLNIDGIAQFLPLNVGITNETFEKRLIKEHYAQIITGYSSKEIFDFVNIRTSLDVDKIYDSIKQYDQLVGKNIEKVKLPTIAKNQQILKYLIYFQNLKYFNLLLQKNDIYSGNYNVNFAIDILASKKDLAHKNKIEQMLNLYKSNFYFVYADLYNDVTEVPDEINLEYNGWNIENQYIVNRKNGPGKNLLERIELATKNKLKKIDIYTSAKAVGQNLTMNIDLSNIQQNLINLTDEPFSNPLIL